MDWWASESRCTSTIASKASCERHRLATVTKNEARHGPTCRSRRTHLESSAHADTPCEERRVPWEVVSLFAPTSQGDNLKAPTRDVRKRGIDRASRAAKNKIRALRRDERLPDQAIANWMANSRYRLAPASHSNADRSLVYTTLLSNDGNVKRTARETGINETTVRRWKKEFLTTPPAQDEDARSEARGGTASDWLSIVRQVLEHAGLPAAIAPSSVSGTKAPFWSKVVRDPETGCWLWTGRLDRKGYGRFGDKLAHRIAWEALRGPLNGRPLHHDVCRRRNCVWPVHLIALPDAATHARIEQFERELDKQIANEQHLTALRNASRST